MPRDKSPRAKTSLTHSIALGDDPPLSSQSGTMRVQSREKTSCCLTRLLFLWVNPLFSRSRQLRRRGRELEAEDMWLINDDDGTAQLEARFRSGLGDIVGASKKSAYRALSRGFLKLLWSDLCITTAFILIQVAMPFTYPLFIEAILRAIESPDTITWRKIGLYSGSLFLTHLCGNVAENHQNYYNMRMSYRSRSTVTTSVYRKSLRLSMRSRQQMSVGEIVNLMQLDATKVSGHGGDLGV